MEDKMNRDMAVFRQVCEANELDPEVIKAEAKKRFADKFTNGQNAEVLIWTALDYRASKLIDDIIQAKDRHGANTAYTIDGDPAAPAFVINEETIRKQYSPDTAERIVNALGQVQMPVTP